MENSDYPNVAKGNGVIILKRNTVANLFRLMRRGRARAGANCTENVTDNGTFIIANPPATDPIVSFELFDASTHNTDGTIAQAKIRVVRGTVNDGSFFGFPTGMNEVDDLILNVGASGVAYVHVSVTVDAVTGNATIDSLEVAAAGSVPDSSETEGYTPLGSWTTNGPGTALNVHGARGDLSYLFCGGIHYFWTASVL